MPGRAQPRAIQLEGPLQTPKRDVKPGRQTDVEQTAAPQVARLNRVSQPSKRLPELRLQQFYATENCSEKPYLEPYIAETTVQVRRSRPPTALSCRAIDVPESLIWAAALGAPDDQEHFPTSVLNDHEVPCAYSKQRYPL